MKSVLSPKQEVLMESASENRKDLRRLDSPSREHLGPRSLVALLTLLLITGFGDPAQAQIGGDASPEVDPT
jgi:hypothetical protein